MSTYKRLLPIVLAVSAAVASEQLTLIEIDPGHSHISGLHNRNLPGVSDTVHIYSPLTPELTAHLAAIGRYNSRPESPTHWSVRLFAGPDYLAEMHKEPAGGIVALSGRNDQKIDYIDAALRGGQHVFADKPWIINTEAFSKLEAALQLAHTKHLVTYDWMTLREETAYRLVRDLAGNAAVFGMPSPGSADKPAVQLENLHALLKFSNGVAQLRPASALDIRQQGEGIADVGTHLADLVQWTLFPGKAISYKTDIRMLKADHSALTLTLEQFTRLTGEAAWPSYLKQDIVDGKLRDFTNGSCIYTIKGVHVGLKVGWQYEAPPGAQDSYFASYQGTRALIELRAGPKERFIPQLYVTPTAANAASWEASLKEAVEQLQHDYSGLSYEKADASFHLLLPKAGRGGDNLQKLFKEFTGFVQDRATFPDFENENLLAKYYVTTSAVALANSHP
jgi:predicted dehydrogenase